MGRAETPAFQFAVRAKQLADEAKRAANTETRDIELEQYLWTPYQHHCYVRNSVAGEQTIAAGEQILTFDTVEFDPEEMWDGSTINTFIEGIWEYSVSAVFDSAADGEWALRLIKNGTDAFTLAGGSVVAATAGEIATGVRKFYMASGDSIQAQINSTAGGVVRAVDNVPCLQATFVTRVRQSGPTSV